MGDFFGKKVVIMGLGLYTHGSGISAAKFFISRGARVVITDLKSKKDLAGQVKSVLRFYECRMQNAECRIHKPVFVLGRHRESDFKSADIVMKNPAVRAGSMYLQIAKKAGAEIETDISLFFKLCAVPIVGITGTRGKSTTTTLIYEILKAAGFDAHLGGNIQISPLSFVNDVIGYPSPPPLYKGRRAVVGARFIAPKSIVVLELSSWMLESTGENRVSPQVALITNIMPDHLNTYAGMADYIAAKENIFKFQRKGGIGVLNYDNPITRKMASVGRGQKFWFGKKIAGDGCFIKAGRIVWRKSGRSADLFSLSDIKLPGEHNLYNILAAAALTSAMGVPAAIIKKTVKSFRGIPNRLEFIREWRGIKFYNDTTATTPDAVIAALKSLRTPLPNLASCTRSDCKPRGARASKFPPLSAKGGSASGTNGRGEGRVILIAGGSDKNLDFVGMAGELKKQRIRLVLFPGKATEKLIAELDKNHYYPEHAPVKNMRVAVKLAISSAKRGDIVLLSPGAASFGLFQNEFDRGRQFVKMIKRLR